ncbi:CBS domain-containing protein [Streptomyces sp. NBC_00654]|uniref:CBS domain-containing protein n=1 Tax=Streptomyces sp. NBC_00654 TaxID=2975799 RepID=UPI00225351D7|nr:CBS domain-containing protein [Streptomyces sp. NBC_00654]MCX4966098.1 CBS domain-containing protein [Streptomyces sp. NBC_00654]
MRHRRISELMTRQVISVRGGTPFKEIARTLSQHQITAVPVVDEGNRVLGVVSEGDLLRKTADRVTAPDDLPAGVGLQTWERAKAEGIRAEELMSAPPVCVRPEWTVAETARLMEAQDVKRLAVVDEEDRLLGIVSRRDLLGIFLRGDDEIRREIVEDVLAGTLHLDPDALAVEVRNGCVELGGRLPFRGMIPAIERMCATVDGVVSVSARFTYDTDDSAAFTPRGERQ